MFVLPLFVSTYVYGGDNFTACFLNYVDNVKKTTVAVVCIDSISMDVKETNCEIAYYIPSQKSIEKTLLFQKNGNWKASKKELPRKMSEQDQDFVNFIYIFSTNKEYQINHIIFPLPVTMKEQSGGTKKKLVMPRDWENLQISQKCTTLCTIQSGRDGNNRKIYIYRQGELKEFYNFIYINKNWYMIEMEVY